MKLTDLMIGDWVQYTYTPYGQNEPRTIVFQVSQIECFLGTGNYYVWGVKEGRVCKVEDLDPIPLTAENLEKNGFEKSNQISDTSPYYMDEDGNIYYSFEQNSINLFWGWWQPDNTFVVPANAMGWISIKHVHELQHALRLCGIEKEIVL